MIHVIFCIFTSGSLTKYELAEQYHNCTINSGVQSAVISLPQSGTTNITLTTELKHNMCGCTAEFIAAEQVLTTFHLNEIIVKLTYVLGKTPLHVRYRM